VSQSSENEKCFKEREKRVMDVVALKKSDRVPLATISDFYFATSQGVNCREAMYDYDKMAAAWKTTAKELDLDMTGQLFSIMSGKVMDIMGIKGFSWPGAADPAQRLPDHLQYQYHEKDLIQADEIDDFLKDPSDFTIRKLMPRMSETIGPLAMVPVGINALSIPYTMIMGVPMMAALLGDIGSKLKQAGEEHLIWQASQDKLIADLKEMGYPTVHNVTGQCAFDWVADNLRGLKGSMLDMYRQPDKLMALVDLFEPQMVEMTLMMAEMSDIKRVFIPLHKGAGGFMNDAQFKKFYWPSLKRYFLALIDHGLTPEPFYEGDYTPRLEYLAELPPGKIMGHYDKIDRKKHKEIMSGIACFWGDVPGSLLVSGTPEKVKDYVKALIDDFADGGLIVDGSANGLPLESKKENVMALIETVREYGKS